MCLITRTLDESVSFYTEKLGFTLRSRMPGFADFQGPGLILALWDARQLTKTTAVPGQFTEQSGHGVMLACELDSPAAIDKTYAALLAKGVEFYAPPADYPWNARCLYFAGPSGELWEYFAWYEGGEPGIVSEGGEGAESAETTTTDAANTATI